MTPLQIIVSFPEGIQRNVNKKPIEIFVFQVIWIDGGRVGTGQVYKVNTQYNQFSTILVIKHFYFVNNEKINGKYR